MIDPREGSGVTFTPVMMGDRIEIITPTGINPTGVVVGLGIELDHNERVRRYFFLVEPDDGGEMVYVGPDTAFSIVDLH